MGRDIKNEILAGSFWENWKYSKELFQMKSSKAQKQLEETEKIRKDWINHQKNAIPRLQN